MSPLLLSLALAADQHLVYDLVVNGQVVGTREVDIRYYPRPGGERRVIDARTRVQLVNRTVDARSNGQSNPRGATFSTSATVDGKGLQVQGVQLPEGDWRLLLSDGRTVNEQSVRSSATILTTLDLLDPGRTALLATPGAVTLVFVETGDQLVGTLGAGVGATSTVGGKKLPVTRYTLTGSVGSARFDVDPNGIVVASEVSWLGVPMSATLREPPPERDFGGVDTIEGMGTTVQEGEL